MDTIEAILTRRSIKQYTAQKVPDDKVRRILQAAMYAPSAKNLQPWHFIVIDKKEIIESMQSVLEHADMLKQTTLLIIVCGDADVEKNIDYIVEECSAATQNALIAVHATGLGGVWLSVYPNKDIINKLREKFDLPGNIIPVSAISIGYPAEVKNTEDRFNAAKIHSNKW